jgi:hypothetical protein
MNTRHARSDASFSIPHTRRRPCTSCRRPSSRWPAAWFPACSSRSYPAIRSPAWCLCSVALSAAIRVHPRAALPADSQLTGGSLACCRSTGGESRTLTRRTTDNYSTTPRLTIMETAPVRTRSTRPLPARKRPRRPLATCDGTLCPSVCLSLRSTWRRLQTAMPHAVAFARALRRCSIASRTDD